jgi:hypothetical protein
MTCLLVVAACGSGSKKTQSASAVTTPTTNQTTTSTKQPSTTAKAKPKVAYPAGGVVDPVFPPGDQAFTMLIEGRCQTLLAKANAWDASVVSAEGADTVFVYRSAAEACRHLWADAVRDFDRIAKPQPQLNCARMEVFKWVAALIKAHQKDPGFDPTFVSPSGRSPCATSSTSTSSTATSSTTVNRSTTTTSSTSVP